MITENVVYLMRISLILRLNEVVLFDTYDLINWLELNEAILFEIRKTKEWTIT